MLWVLYRQLKALIPLDGRLQGPKAGLDVVVMRKVFILLTFYHLSNLAPYYKKLFCKIRQLPVGTI